MHCNRFDIIDGQTDGRTDGHIQNAISISPCHIDVQ